MRRIGLLFSAGMILILFSFRENPGALPEPGAVKLKKIVIDAGHGGHDPGAVGSKHKEKDITLSLALKLGEYLNKNLPDVEIIYTRKTDVFVELYRRARIANENKADLFISLHCNATKTQAAYGTETWVMGLSKSQANLEVAKKENASILMENDYLNQYDGFDPNSTEAYIIFSLYQNIYLDQSLNLAAKIQNQFEQKAGRFNRGVKQAGFLVLYKTTMPGLLVEAGFISNPEEEKYLASDAGQNTLAACICRAIMEYKNELEGNTKAKPDSTFININPKTTYTKSDTVNNQVFITKENNSRDTLKTVQNPQEKPQEIYFRVQFATSPAPKPLNSPDFKGLKDVREYFHNGLYKYTVGNETTLESAARLQAEIQKKGFKDAFVVAFLNDKRISPDEAVKMLKNQKK